MRWLVLIACLAGCDQLFGLVHVDQQTVDAAAVCPASYNLAVATSPTVYRYEPTNKTWLDAELSCETESAGITHLIVLSDDTERLGIVGALADTGVTTTIWIGLSDRISEGSFRWVSAEPVGMPPLENPPWPPGQPDDNGGQDCVRIQGSTTVAPTLFDDTQCGLMFDYVCECDAYAPDPRNF